MTRIACLMMQKNEDEHLEPWLVYHSDLFGLENLLVIDNGSTGRSLAILAEYEKRGLQVNYEFGRHEDFLHKGAIITDMLQYLKKTGKYDLYIPLDCDEFIVLQQADGSFTAEKDDILQYLGQFGRTSLILRVAANLANKLGSPNRYWLWKYSKIILANSTAVALDRGFHQATAAQPLLEVPIDIVYVHMHYRPYDDILQHSRDKIVSQVDTTDATALENYRGPGWHVTTYFLGGAEQYYDRFTAPGSIEFVGLANRIEQLGAKLPYLDFQLPNRDK